MDSENVSYRVLSMHIDDTAGKVSTVVQLQILN